MILSRDGDEENTRPPHHAPRNSNAQSEVGVSCTLEGQTRREERKTTSPTENHVVLVIIAVTECLVSCVQQEVTSMAEPLPQSISREAEEPR